MSIAAFAFPTTILFAAGSLSALRGRLSDLGCRRPLIVTDMGLVATRAFRQTVAAAPAEHRVFSSVQSNPTEQEVEAATSAFVDNGCDGVIGLGGGSAIDVAKILRL